MRTALVVVITLFLSQFAEAQRAESVGSITEYTVAAGGDPFYIALGPDGALWFTQASSSQIGRITAGGSIAEYTIPTRNSGPTGIVAGPGGDLWFTERSGGKIGKVTIEGVFTEYALPNNGNQPSGITVGPDGALWFTDYAGPNIGRITTSGSIKEYPAPTQCANIATGADGALWFTEGPLNSIGRMTTSGSFTRYPTPTSGSSPNGITAGPDGALWFSEFDAGKIGRITTAGKFTEYSTPTEPSGPVGIVTGPDGALWFTEYSGNQIGRITTGGSATEYPIPTPNAASYFLANGADGNMWFTEFNANKLGRISLPGTATTTLLEVSSEILAMGMPATLTATVADRNKASVIHGQVDFCNAGAAHCTNPGLLGTAQLTPAGTAKIVLALAPGTHRISAHFRGTNLDSPSASSAQTVTVTGALPTSTALGPPIGTVADYNLTSTVTTGGVKEPIGSVAIQDTSVSGSPTVKEVQLDPTTARRSFPRTGYSVGTAPWPVAVGDFNGDGKLDLAVGNGSDNTVSILLGNGDGTFQPQTIYPTGIGPDSIAVGDFNGDGFLDLAVVNYGGFTVSILLGNGDGTFQTQVAYGTGAYPYSVAVGDFNGDGRLDLAIGNGSASVGILLGNGDGTFQAQVTYPAGGQITSIAVGDFTGNGTLDIAVANYGDNTVGVFLGNGDGTFKAQTTYATGKNPASVAVGDFSGNGILDLAAANRGDNTVSVLLGNGNGTFQEQKVYETESSPGAIAVGDLNGDGNLDVAVSNLYGGTVSVLLGNGDGTFETQTAYSTGSQPDSIALGDFNGDGTLDIVTTDNYPGLNSISLLLNQWMVQATASDVTVGGIPATQAVQAVYSGDARYSPSTSNAVNLTSTGPYAATPVMTPPPGQFACGTPVTLTDSTLSAAIYYTTNATAPTASSTLYQGPITVISAETIEAIAVASGYTNSAIASSTYTTPPCIVAKPVIAPAGGTYPSIQLVTITDKTAGASIFYTDDRTPPSASSTPYTGPIWVNADQTIKAIGTAAYYKSSAAASAAFTLIGSPTVLAAPATAVSTPNAKLNASVNTLGLPGSFYFQYGTNSNSLDSSTAVTALSASTVPVAVSAQLTRLASKTTYFFEIVASTAGGTSSGAILSFTTN
jgi:streptogramin lyase